MGGALTGALRPPRIEPSNSLEPTTTISRDYRYFPASEPEIGEVVVDEFDREYEIRRIGLNVRFRV